MGKMKFTDWLSYSLVTVGAINWGIYGVSRMLDKPFDLVTWLGSVTWNPLSNIIFLVVGLAGLYSLVTAVKLANN
jgi:uncharacterized membrane protein YuzA (DUF378 family)